MNTDNKNLYTTGITIDIIKNGYNTYQYLASCEWNISGMFANNKAIKGTLTTKYPQDTLKEAIECLLEFINGIGVEILKPFALYSETSNLKIIEQLQFETQARGWDLCNSIEKFGFRKLTVIK